MYKKIFIQLLLLLIALSIIASILYFYFFNPNSISQNKNINELEKIKEKPVEIIKDENKDSDTSPANLIENLKYLSKDNEGNEYEIKAEKGKINILDSEIIYMSNVSAIIRLKNSAPIFIDSDYATYNKKNHTTNFSENVLITHLSHKVTGNNLDLSFENNVAIMSNEIIYTNMNTILNADRLEIDLITKNSKIFMDDKNEKIKILVK
tara:strand:+ start:444 stop:1067 length:624 start_codon:yes stop_codon:yes gene_type:complete